MTIPEGLYIDRSEGFAVIRDAQDVPWVTIHPGGHGDPDEWYFEIERRVVAALAAEEITA